MQIVTDYHAHLKDRSGVVISCRDAQVEIHDRNTERLLRCDRSPLVIRNAASDSCPRLSAESRDDR